MIRFTARLLVLLTLTVTLAAQSGSESWGRSTRDYDGRLTFVRVRYGSGFGGGRNSSWWNHDFPRAEQNLMRLLKELTLLDANTNGSLILTLDDPQLFRYPIAMMWEPGYWDMSDAEAAAFRTYLLKGGMAIFDDFELEQLENFTYQIKRVLPGAQLIKLDQSHLIFDSFFRMKTINFPHPMMGLMPNYYGIFEDNDPSKRLLVIANHNADVAEYWEFLGQGLFPVDPSNEAYKLGVNYYVYALTH